MQGREKRKAPRIKWLDLFLPEDSGAPMYRQACILRFEGGVGDLKFWVWVIIAIIVALALGQL